MLMVPLGVLCALVIALALGGRLGGLARLRFRAPGVLWLAVGVQFGLKAVAPGHRSLALGCGYGLVGLWLVLNRRQADAAVGAGVSILTAGWLLNMVPVVLNGGMPVSGAALRRVGAPAAVPVADGHFYRHVAAGPHTILSPLGDILPVRPLSSVISIGDIVITAGIMVVVVAAMTRRPRPPEQSANEVALPAPVAGGS